MTLSGFNQEGGSVAGNIKNLKIESLQNTSKTDGYTIGGNISVGITNAGAISGNIHGSKTKGNGEFVDNQTTFIVGENSNLKIGNVDNTASIIGATDNGKIEIDNYTGRNLENHNKLKTVGGSIGTSGVGINYSNSEKEGITRNTVTGNVEIANTNNSNINYDITKANEITKDSSFSTNIYAERQLIEAVANPNDFKTKIEKATQELKDMKNVVLNTIENKGKDNRNFVELLNNQRRATTINNLLGNDIKNILENSKDIQKDLSNLIENFGKDLGLNLDIEYASNETMPEISKTSSGSAFINKETKRATIVINVDKINSTSEYVGTLFEELSHIIDGIAGRQDLTVANDKTNDEEGLESLGRLINDYFQEEFVSSNKEILLQPDGKDYSKLDLGEKVGDMAEIIINKNIEKLSFAIKNTKNKEKVYLDIVERSGKKVLLNNMIDEYKDVNISILSKKLFAIYGASESIRKIYLIKELDEKKEYRDMLVLDEVSPEDIKALWKSPQTSYNLYKISDFWADKSINHDEFKLSYEDREKSTKARPDFTTSKQFYALGSTLLHQSTYGSIKKVKEDQNLRYDINITVIFQYVDKFEDVANINPLYNAGQNKGMEIEGGLPFNIRTNPKKVNIIGSIKDFKEIEDMLLKKLKEN